MIKSYKRKEDDRKNSCPLTEYDKGLPPPHTPLSYTGRDLLLDSDVGRKLILLLPGSSSQAIYLFLSPPLPPSQPTLHNLPSQPPLRNPLQHLPSPTPIHNLPQQLLSTTPSRTSLNNSPQEAPYSEKNLFPLEKNIPCTTLKKNFASTRKKPFLVPRSKTL